MDITTLMAVIVDLRQTIVPSRLEKAQQSDLGTIQIALRTLKGLTWLEISWDAYAPRLVQIPPPPRSATTSTLAQQLQHGLSHLALVSINQNGFERIVEFQYAQRPGEVIEKSLVLEIMGRHSNLFLLDKNRKVITLGRKVRNHQSRTRPISTGDVYVTPPPLKGIEPISKESFVKWKTRLKLLPINLKQAMQDSYQGISPSIALQIAHNNKSDAENLLKRPVGDISNQELVEIHKRWCIWLQCVESGQFNLAFKGPSDYRVWGEHISKVDSRKDLSLHLGQYYQDHLERKRLNELIKTIKQKLLNFIKAERTSLSNHANRLDSSEDIESLRKKADSLLCLISPTSEQIKEAQKLYKRAKKLRRSIPILKERIAYHKERLFNLLESDLFLEEIITDKSEDCRGKIERIMEIDQELNKSLNLHKKDKKNTHSVQNKPIKPLFLLSPGGLKIQIGRNHQQNDWISIKSARTGDLWFHAQECPGSHVVLKASAGLAEDADIQMAADLAALFSKAKGNAKVAVIMTPTNELKRIPGTLPGTVRHRKGEVLWGEPFRGQLYINP